jgi:hypothetical protein
MKGNIRSVPNTVRKRYKDYNWSNEGVFSDDVPFDFNLFFVYTKKEIDDYIERYIIIDKANKYLPNRHGNIALLDSSGDLLDSEVHPDDLLITDVFDGGLFDNDGEIEE